MSFDSVYGRVLAVYKLAGDEGEMRAGRSACTAIELGIFAYFDPENYKRPPKKRADNFRPPVRNFKRSRK